MKDIYEATVDSKGRVTVPVAMRRRLDLAPGSRVRFVPDSGGVIISRALDLEDLIGSLRPLPPPASPGLRREIEEATEEGVEKTWRPLQAGRPDWSSEPEVFDLESVIGSVPALPGVTTDDFERLTEDATEEAAARQIENMRATDQDSTRS